MKSRFFVAIAVVFLVTVFVLEACEFTRADLAASERARALATKLVFVVRGGQCFAYNPDDRVHLTPVPCSLDLCRELINSRDLPLCLGK